MYLALLLSRVETSLAKGPYRLGYWPSTGHFKMKVIQTSDGCDSEP